MSPVESDEEDLTRKQRREQARAGRKAAEEAAASDAARRKRLTQLGGAVAVVVVAIIIVLVAAGGGSSSKPPAVTSTTAIKQVAAVESTLGGATQNGNVLGSPTAPVTMQYFGDLECPICKDFTLGALSTIIQKWVKTGKLKIEYRSLETATREPETFRTQQVAMLAAGKQNKAWNYIELFYHEQGEEGSGYVTESYLQGLAKQVPGLNLAKWTADRGEPQLQGQIAKDTQEANNQGFTGTPAFLIGKTGVPGKKYEYTLAIGSVGLRSSVRKSPQGLAPADERPGIENDAGHALGDRHRARGLPDLHPLRRHHAALLDQGQPVQPGAEIGVLGSRGNTGRPPRADRLHRHPRDASGARSRDAQAGDGRDLTGRVRLQHVPDLPRGLHAGKNLRVVRRQRGAADDHHAPVRLAVPARRGA